MHQLAGAEPLAELTRLLGDETVAETIAGAIGVTTTSAATGGEIQWSVRRLLESVAAERPLVLVLDDLHWAEPAFLDLVDYLHDFMRAAPVLLVAIGSNGNVFPAVEGVTDVAVAVPDPLPQALSASARTDARIAARQRCTNCVA